MKENTTYNPQDIEDLLMHKSFDELQADEKEFVLTQVENEAEYREMRNTLLTVQQIALEQESVYVPNSIKEDLMKLMEEKRKPLGWFGSIAAFLFPSDTSLFKKPGLQLATLGLMLLLVINIGIDFVKQPQKEMAINTNKVLEETKLEEEIKESKTREIEIRKPSLNNGISKSEAVDTERTGGETTTGANDKLDVEEIEKVAIPPVIAEVVEEIAIESEPAMDVNANELYDVKEMVQSDEEVAVKKDVETRSQSNSSVVTLNEVVTLSSKVVTRDKSKKIAVKAKSQSLGANAEVIDLLFVAL